MMALCGVPETTLTEAGAAAVTVSEAVATVTAGFWVMAAE